MSDFFRELPSILEVFLNFLEFFAIVVSVTTFFFLMINKFSRALKHVLGPCGMGFWPRVRALFCCRRSQIKKRAFLEYAILKTGGSPVIHAQWHTIINSFKAFYVEAEQGNLVYTIPNCTALIGADFSQAVERYFAYFSVDDVKKVFGIQEVQLSWVIRIRIEEAYATPTCLLTGLLSQYDESWEEFIKRYVSTAYINETEEKTRRSVLSNELYFTFAWLLWGPSYELEYRNYWAGLCQLSYGDESNSLPAVADTGTDVAEALKNKFIENEQRRYGALLSADISICEKKTFFASLRGVINPENEYFYDKAENGEFSFAVRIDGFSPCVNYKAKKYYSTAYVWVLFEQEDGDFSFKPEKSVAFFEHANLASKESYGFLVETLIDKCLKHFESIYADPENADRRYRFVCAMNDKIATACKDRFSAVMAEDSRLGEILRERVCLEPKHTPATVFAAYDEYFFPSKSLSYVGVSLRDKNSISDFGQFYTDIYMESFPDEDERESFDHFLSYLKKGEAATDYNYHVLLAKDEAGRIVGGGVFNYFKESNSGVIEFLAVRSDLQSGGIGTALYKQIVAILSEDAQRACGKRLDYIFCEIDSPEYSRAEVKKYLYFWHKNNYSRLSFPYVQPALSAGQKPVTGLWFTVSPQREQRESVPTHLVRSVLHAYLKYAMDIPVPEACAEYQRMVEALGTGEVRLEKIIQ